MKNIKILKIAKLSFLINFLYAAYNLFIGITANYVWFVLISIYHAILCLLRIFLLYPIKAKQENKDVRLCGKVFIVLSLCLALITYLSYEKNRGAVYNEIVVITIAVYAFSKIILSIINLAKSNNSGRDKALKNISFADALVSIFSLQRTMFSSFEGMTDFGIKIFNGLTGTVIYIFIFIMGLNLIGGKRITMVKSRIIEVNEKIAESVTDGYKKIENGVVSSYKKFESGVVNSYNKIEDAFVEKYLTKGNATKEEAKEHISKDK